MRLSVVTNGLEVENPINIYMLELTLQFGWRKFFEVE
jgi:hypothetical protein